MARGDLRTITNARGDVTTYTYDRLGRKRSMKDPDLGYGTGTRQGLWEFWWDANGNQRRILDARGNVIVTRYDELNRITARVASDDPAAQPFVSYEYADPAIANAVGRLTCVTTRAVVTTFDEYDSAGRSVSVTRAIAGAPRSYRTRTEYDLAGRISAIEYPDQYRVLYSYHPGTSLLSEVRGEGDAHVYASLSTYDAASRPQNVAYANGTVTSRMFDPFSGELSEMNVVGPGLSASPKDALQYVGVGTTREGDIHSLVDYRIAGILGRDPTSLEYGYSYDPSHRIVSEMSPGAAPDAATTPFRARPPAPGPVMTAPAHAFSIVEAGDTAHHFEFDPNGNMTTGWDLSNPTVPVRRDFRYDIDNRTSSIAVTRNAQTSVVEFEYDHRGERISKGIAGSGSRTYYVGDLFEVTSSGSGVRETRYVFAGTTRVARVSGGVATYYHPDHLGSTVATSNGDGALTWSGAYSPFGVIRRQDGVADVTHLFGGRAYDGETGLYYFGARYYDPVLARFTSPDVVIAEPYDPGSLNRFSFALNNPLRFTDPTGHTAVDQFGSWLLEQGIMVTVGYGGQYNGGFGVGVSVGGHGPDGNATSGEIQIVGDSFDPWVWAAAGSAVLLADDVTGVGAVDDVLIPALVVSAATYDVLNRWYVTYTLFNPITKQVYAGMTSGFGTPQQIADAQYARHVRRRMEGFLPPKVDSYAQGGFGYAAIRGREQQLIDSFGGVGNPRVGNDIRAVNADNPAGPFFHFMSNVYWGELAPYTGNRMWDMPDWRR